MKQVVILSLTVILVVAFFVIFFKKYSCEDTETDDELEYQYESSNYIIYLDDFSESIPQDSTVCEELIYNYETLTLTPPTQMFL